MLSDFRALGDNPVLQADLCIIGSGAAGLAVAVSLLGSRHRICVLESGGMDFEPETQALYQGETAGVPWGAGLDGMRSRCFGGTTNRWPGGCIRLDQLDFQPRPWVPFSGWPIGRDALDPWYEQARAILQLPDTPFDDGGAITRDPPPEPFDPDRLAHRRTVRSREPRLGVAHGASLAASDTVEVLLHANLLELRACASAAAVAEAHIGTLDGRRGRVRARMFVLACGGIENARLLLLSNSVMPPGLGNAHGLVGRFFMDHPMTKLGEIVSAEPERLAHPYNRQVALPGVPRPGDLLLAPAAQEAQQVLNARLRPQDYEEADAIPPAVIAARELNAARRRGRLPDDAARQAWRVVAGLPALLPAVARRLRGKPVVTRHRLDLEGYFEQAPNPDSRITLVDRCDRLGQRQARLDWRLTELDRRSYRVAAATVGAELARLGLGTLQLEPWLRDEPAGDPPVVGTAHHLGATRMADDPTCGVVDRNCRVHGIDNLYVAGGSVFPTGGAMPPTFTIVALAMRLAHHLDQRLQQERSLSLASVDA